MFRNLLRSWRQDIRVRLYAGIFLAVSLSTGLYTTYEILTLRKEADQHVQERLERLVTVVSESLARPLYDFNSAAVSSTVSALGASNDVVHVRVLDPAGNLLAQSKAPGVLPARVASARRGIIYKDEHRVIPVGEIELTLSWENVAQDLKRHLIQTGIANLVMTLAIIALL
jgi:hypothetical protein